MKNNINKDLEAWYSSSLDKLKEKLKNSNPMSIPKIEKIVLNIGLKEAVSNSKVVTTALNVVTAISGQKALKTLARKSIAGFKLRDGMPIGVCVTLRGVKMKAFLSKLINLALPRVRDFQGTPKKLDGRGNYNLGLKDITVFPEAESAAADFNSGLNISFVTTTKNDDLARELLLSFGMPFIRK